MSPIHQERVHEKIIAKAPEQKKMEAKPKKIKELLTKFRYKNSVTNVPENCCKVTPKNSMYQVLGR